MIKQPKYLSFQIMKDQSYVTHQADIVKHKQFVNQKNDKPVTNQPWILNSTTKEDFLYNIWLEIEPHIKREMIVDVDKPSWAEQVQVYIELGKFVQNLRIYIYKIAQ